MAPKVGITESRIVVRDVAHRDDHEMAHGVAVRLK